MSLHDVMIQKRMSINDQIPRGIIQISMQRSQPECDVNKRNKAQVSSSKKVTKVTTKSTCILMHHFLSSHQILTTMSPLKETMRNVRL